jgi:uncharacterized protein (DUF1330 family)
VEEYQPSESSERFLSEGARAPFQKNRTHLQEEKHMAAYLIVDLTITDAQGFKEYQQRVGATLAPYGGTFLVRGGAHETMEGDWHPQTLVILHFASIERAWQWYQSPEYMALSEQRNKTAITRAVVVEGV